jgi:hypothetical protein
MINGWMTNIKSEINKKAGKDYVSRPLMTQLFIGRNPPRR